MQRKLAIASTLTLAVGLAASAQVALMPVPIPAGLKNAFVVRLSPDGKYAVGRGERTSDFKDRAIVWQRGIGTVQLSGQASWVEWCATDMNDDLSIISGWAKLASGATIPARWYSGTATGASLTGGATSEQFDCASDDESRRFGRVTMGAVTHPAVFKSDVSWNFLDQTYTDGSSITNAHVLASSSGGLYAVGYGSKLTPQGSKARAIRWYIDANGNSTATELPLLAMGTFAYAYGMSNGGATLCGWGDSLVGNRAFRWNSSVGTQMLAWDPSDSATEALNVSGDGQIFVGAYTSNGQRNGRIWLGPSEFINLSEIFGNAGVNTAGAVQLVPSEATYDGFTIAGTGYFNGNLSGFIADLRCLADLNNDWQVDLADFFQFFNDFDQTLPGADIDGTPGVDLGDYFTFLNHFDQSC